MQKLPLLVAQLELNTWSLEILLLTVENIQRLLLCWIMKNIKNQLVCLIHLRISLFIRLLNYLNLLKKMEVLLLINKKLTRRQNYFMAALIVLRDSIGMMLLLAADQRVQQFGIWLRDRWKHYSRKKLRSRAWLDLMLLIMKLD